MRRRQQNRILARPCIPALALMLAGCSGGEIVQNLPSASPDPPPPDYRRVVATSINTIFPAQALAGDLEISEARLVDHLKGPAWLTCVKLDAHGHPQEYALFIQGDKVIDWRAGVVMDQCYKQTYSPLQTATAAKKTG